MKKSSITLISPFSTLIVLLLFTTTTLTAQYCPLESTEPDSDHITNITFAEIDNTTQSSTYSDYTDLIAYVSPGLSYPISATMFNADMWKETLTVYIDWNQDDIFTENERYEIGSCTDSGCATSGITGWIDVPHTALIGTTRMRAIGQYDEYITSPCEPFDFGEVEDYTVNISMGECTPPNFEYVITNNCENETYNVAAILNDFGTNDFISVAMTRSDGVEVFPIVIENDLPQGYLFELINDVPTGITVTAVIQTVNPLCNLNRTWLSLGCYCMPEFEWGCEYDSHISNVTLPGETIDLDNSSECSDGAYAYYPDLPQPDLAPGELYTLTVSTAYDPANFQQAIAWIDFNKDSEFDENELIGNTNGAGLGNANGTFHFVVPQDQAPGSYRLRVRMAYGSEAPDWDACATLGEGETEDYLIEILELSDCEGTPTAGTIQADQDTYCPNTTIRLLADGGSDPANGLIRIWQSSPTGEDNWTDIEGASSAEYFYTQGIDQITDFRYIATCILSGESDVSNVLEIGLRPAVECYCIPEYEYGCAGDDYISNVNLPGVSVTLDNFSTCSEASYGDYTDQPQPDLAPGETYAITVSTGYFSPTDDKLIAWIDYNKNGIFEPNEQIANTGESGFPMSGTITFDFTVPDFIEPGDYRLRVRIVNDWQDLPPTFTACSTEGNGETEDYTVTVIQLDACEGTPNAGTPDENAFTVCAQDPFYISVSDASDPAEGLTRIWQASPSGQNEWADIAGAFARNFQVTNGINEPTDFRYYTFCANSNETNISGTIQVGLSPGTECYCIPVYSWDCEYGEQISNVTLEGENTAINYSSACGEGGYADYTDQPKPDLIPGETYAISVSTDYPYPTDYKVIAWIDYNENGIFETSEQIANTGESGFPMSGTVMFEFMVPDNVTPGDYRMRVRMVNDWQSLPPTFTACSVEDNGEAEDYMVTIMAPDACEGTPSAGTPDDLAFIVCAETPFNVSVSGASDPAGSLIRVWQSSPSGQNEWTDIEGASARDYQVANGISEPTDFRYYTMCTPSGESNVSDVIEVGLKPGVECYCVPQYVFGCSENDIISNVTLQGESITLDNNSECSDNAFGDYTQGLPKPDLAPGQSYSISVSTDYGLPDYEEVIAWIDYNENGHFEADEIIASTTGMGLESGSLSFEFTVPEGPEVGEYRMRVRLVFDWTGNPPSFDECGNEEYGETEDYTVTIINMDACQGTPAAGTPDDAAFNVCPLTSFIVSVSDASDPADGLTGIWQSSSPGQNDWSDITGAASRNYTVSQGIQEPTDFRYIITCSYSSESDISDIIQVGTKPPNECYCIPTNNSYTEYFISSVITTGGLQNLNRQSGFTDGGYADYTQTDTLIVNPAQTIDFSLSFEIGTQLVRVWVDLNQDGIFHDTEVVITTGESYMQSPFTGSFTLPEILNPGNYRMRIRTTSFNTPVLPCGNDNYSETEDYILKVTAPEDTFCDAAVPVECNVAPASYNSETSAAPNTTACEMGSNGLWFKFEGTGWEITVTTTASFNHKMSVNTGECNDLTSVACVDDGDGPETYTIPESVEGQTYYIYVADQNAAGTSTGTIEISIDCLELIFYCGELEAYVGEACDDGDDSTENDIVTEDCECEGTPIIYDCQDLQANIGDPCNNDTIQNGEISDDCECEPIVSATNPAQFNFTMYPNPVDHTESLTLSSKQAIARYEVFDITGKLIDAKTILNQSEIKIALSDYSAGLYILKVYSGSDFAMRKMVIR